MATPISDEEMKLLAAFKELKVKPKADSVKDLDAWLKAYGGASGATGDTGATTPAISVNSHQPRLSIFYGDTISVTKGEVTYDQWRYEIRSMLLEKTYKLEVIAQAIRRSVRGEAGRIMMRLGPGSSMSETLDKFESVYGVVDSKEALLAKFYSAQQTTDEDVTQWSCRLEDILNSAVERGISGCR